MKEKNKKIFNICMTCLLTITVSAVATTYVNMDEKDFEDDTTAINSNEIVFEDGNEIDVDNDLTNDVPKDIYDSDFYKKTYYVHRNDKRTILSQNEKVDGYDLLGVYASRSSADAVLYMIIDNGDGTSFYKIVSYDDMEKLNNNITFYIVDENTPENLTGAFVPDVSINSVGHSKNYSK